MPALPYSPNFDASPSQSSGLLVAQGSAMAPTIAAPDVLRIYGDEPYARDCVRDDTDGYPLPPCQMQQRPGVIGGILIPVNAGAQITIMLNCKYTGAIPPRMIVRANPDVGLLADLFAVAPQGSGWVNVVATFTPSADGVVDVDREQCSSNAFTKWDNLQITFG